MKPKPNYLPVNVGYEKKPIRILYINTKQILHIEPIREDYCIIYCANYEEYEIYADYGTLIEFLEGKLKNYVAYSATGERILLPDDLKVYFNFVEK